MKPLRTDHFLFFPRKASNVGLETAISETVALEQVGSYLFRDPIFRWHRIQAQEVLVVCFDEWALGRLAFEMRTDVVSMVEFDFSYVKLPIEVWQADTIVAALELRASPESSQWHGQAVSFSIGKTAIAELEAALAAEPLGLSSYELEVPGRGTIGWSGQRFRGERRFVNPRLDIPLPRDEFRIMQSSRALAATGETTTRRFTATWPPKALLEFIPNWVFAYDEEMKSGESFPPLVPASNQRKIDSKIAYSAGEAWLADGRILPCLIGLDEGHVYNVVCLDDSRAWEVTCPPDGCDPIVELTADESSLFPLRVVSRLSRSASNPSKTIRFKLTAEGKILSWKFSENK